MSKRLTIIGDNYISKILCDDFKRYGKFKLSRTNNLNNIKLPSDIIIDCTFKYKHQDSVIAYCEINNINELILLNYSVRDNIKKHKIKQCILHDMYYSDSPGFLRDGFGNDFDPPIEKHNFISETIRRIHEAKYNNYPIIRLSYSENELRYCNANKIYTHISSTIKSTKNIVSIYDECKYVDSVVGIIKNIIGYEGEIVVNSGYSKSRVFDKVANNKDKLDYQLRHLYKRLLLDNIFFIK